MSTTHIGSSLDDFLMEEGTFDATQALAILGAKLLHGLNGAAIEMTDTDWKAMRQEVQARVKSRNGDA